MSILKYCIKALRPKQWVKNSLIFAAPLASTKLSEYFFEILIGFISFISASSMGYLVNDWLDRSADKLHESKRRRPFASGDLGKKHFIFLFSTTLILTVSGAIYLGTNFAVVLIIYLFITFAYSLAIKRVAIIEMVWLALGFLVRAVAGSVVVEVTPTGWFNIVVFFGALFVVSTKRLSEKLHTVGNNTRKVLDDYDENILSSVANVSAASTVLTFCLWVIQEHSDSYIAQLSILPFVSSILLYGSSSRSSMGESPEDILISNKLFLLTTFISCALLGVVFYR